MNFGWLWLAGYAGPLSFDVITMDSSENRVVDLCARRSGEKRRLSRYSRFVPEFAAWQIVGHVVADL